MQFKVQENDPFAVASIQMNQGEIAKIKTGAVLYFNDQIKLEGGINSQKKGLGGVVSALGRSIASGETMFVSSAQAIGDQAEITVAPQVPGNILQLSVDNAHRYHLNDGAFLASDNSVDYKITRQAIGKSIFGGTGGFFIMETEGSGNLLVSAFGNFMKLTLDGSQTYSVDNYHVVAWSTTLDYDIRPASGVIGFKTGEGLINHFSGQGEVYIQTRNLSDFGGALDGFIDSDSTD